MGDVDLDGQVVFILPGGWITSDEAFAMREWRQKARWSDHGTAAQFFCDYPPKTVYRPASGTVTTCIHT